MDGPLPFAALALSVPPTSCRLPRWGAHAEQERHGATGGATLKMPPLSHNATTWPGRGDATLGADCEISKQAGGHGLGGQCPSHLTHLEWHLAGARVPVGWRIGGLELWRLKLCFLCLPLECGSNFWVAQQGAAEVPPFFVVALCRRSQSKPESPVGPPCMHWCMAWIGLG